MDIPVTPLCRTVDSITKCRRKAPCFSSGGYKATYTMIMQLKVI